MERLDNDRDPQQLRCLLAKINHLEVKYAVSLGSGVNSYVASIGKNFKYPISCCAMNQTYFFLRSIRQSAD